MRIVYTLEARQRIAATALPSPCTIEGVDVEWKGNGNQITGMRLILRGRPVRSDANSGRVVVRDAGDDRDAFRVASYLTDTILALSGIDAFSPGEIFSQSPLAVPEDLTEAATISQSGTTNALTVRTSMALSATLQSGKLPANIADSRAIESYAQGMRAEHPFDQFVEFFKVIEFYVLKQWNSKKRRLEERKGGDFDVWVSNDVQAIDGTFDAKRVEKLRNLRAQITHPQAIKGPLSRHNPSDVAQVKCEVPDIKKLATIMEWRTPTPWS